MPSRSAKPPDSPAADGPFAAQGSGGQDHTQATRIEVEQLIKCAHNIWPANPTLLKAGATLTLASIALTLPVADTYEGTSMAA